MEGQELAARHIALREQAGLTQEQEAKMAGISPTTISGIESGKIRRPHLKTLLKIARALGTDVGELRESGKAQAPPSSTQPPLNGFEQERRTVWESAVENARQLREGGQARMAELLSAWRASKQRQEDPTERRGYLDEMGDLLQKAYDVQMDLFRNFSGAPPTQTRRAVGKEEANYVPDSNWEEVREADHFYFRLRWMAEADGLSIRTEDGEAAAEHEAPAERAQSETRPLKVEEPEAA